MRSPSARLAAPAIGFALVALAMGGPRFVMEARGAPRDEIFRHLFSWQEVPGAALVLVLVAAAWAGRNRLSRRRLTAWLAAFARRPVLVVAATLLALIVGTDVVYHRHPLSLDEYTQLYQAEVFARGRLFVTIPPPLLDRLVPLHFVNWFWLYSPSTGFLASAYWPGFSLLLAPFVALGVPWLLNPLLAVGSLVLLARLARKLFADPLAPALVILFCLASPEFVVDAVSYYAMTGHFFLNLLFVSLLLDPTPRRLVAAGLVGSSALVLHNPVPHALVALPWIVSLARRRGARGLLLLGAGYLPLSVVLGLGWFYLRTQFTAEWSMAMESARAAGAVAPADASLPAAAVSLLRQVFRPPDAELLVLRLAGWAKLCLWAVPGLPFAAILGYRSLARGGASEVVRSPGYLRLVGWSAGCTLVGYLFIPVSQGHGWGFRYFHQAWWALPLLATAATSEWRRTRSPAFQLIVLCIASSFVFNNGLRLWQTERFVDRHLAQKPELGEGFEGIVFLDLSGATGRGYYRQDLVQHDPFLDGGVLYLVSQGTASDLEFLRRWELDARCTSTPAGDLVCPIPTAELDVLRRAGAPGGSAAAPG